MTGVCVRQKVKLFEEVREGTRDLAATLVKNNPILFGWHQNQLKKHRGDALLLQQLQESAVVDGYRNKYDFKIGECLGWPIGMAWESVR